MQSGLLTETIDIERLEETPSPYGANLDPRWRTVLRTRANRIKHVGKRTEEGEVFSAYTAVFEIHYYVHHRIQLSDRLTTTRGKYRILSIDTDEVRGKAMITAELINE